MGKPVQPTFGFTKHTDKTRENVIKWTPLYFGKHKGKTLPQVLFTDPDYFFWAFEDGIFKGTLLLEARDIFSKATSIKVPDNENSDFAVLYYVHEPSGKFGLFEVIPHGRQNGEGRGESLRLDVIDMSIPYKWARYDKLGYRSFIRSMKFYVFGSSSFHLTKKRCEEFFSNPENFD